MALMQLHTKYQRPGPSSVRQKDVCKNDLSIKGQGQPKVIFFLFLLKKLSFTLPIQAPPEIALTGPEGAIRQAHPYYAIYRKLPHP